MIIVNTTHTSIDHYYPRNSHKFPAILNQSSFPYHYIISTCILSLIIQNPPLFQRLYSPYYFKDFILTLLFHPLYSLANSQ